MRPPERLALSVYHKGLVADLEPESVEILRPNGFAVAYLCARRGGIRTLAIDTTASAGAEGGTSVERFLETLASTDVRVLSGVRHLRLRVNMSFEPGRWRRCTPESSPLIGSALRAFPALDTLELYTTGAGGGPRGDCPLAFAVVVPTAHPIRRLSFDGGPLHHLQVLAPSGGNRAANGSRELVVRGHFEIPRTAWRRVEVDIDHAEVSIREALWSLADVPIGTLVLRLGRARTVGLAGCAAAGKLACGALEIRCHPETRTLRVTGTSFDAVGAIVVRGASVSVLAENPSLLSRIQVVRAD